LPVSSQAVQDKIKTLFAFQLGGVAISEDSKAAGSVPMEVSANSTNHNCFRSLGVVRNLLSLVKRDLPRIPLQRHR
jgi:hypothetical protein